MHSQPIIKIPLPPYAFITFHLPGLPKHSLVTATTQNKSSCVVTVPAWRNRETGTAVVLECDCKPSNEIQTNWPTEHGYSAI